MSSVKCVIINENEKGIVPEVRLLNLFYGYVSYYLDWFILYEGDQQEDIFVLNVEIIM